MAYYYVIYKNEGAHKSAPSFRLVIIEPLACLLQNRGYTCCFCSLVLQPLLFAFFVIAALAFQKIIGHFALLFLPFCEFYLLELAVYDANLDVAVFAVLSTYKTSACHRHIV